MSRVCPHCGSDTWKAEDYDRLSARMQVAEDELRRRAVALAKGEFERLVDKDSRAGLQRKVRRQAATIRRLEEKLRGLGQFPHAGVKPWEAAPVEQHEAEA